MNKRKIKMVSTYYKELNSPGKKNYSKFYPSNKVFFKRFNKIDKLKEKQKKKSTIIMTYFNILLSGIDKSGR